MQEARKVRLVRVSDDRDLGTWGKSVRQLCDGVASNDARFAVGWLEGDDTVWIVHGPATAGGAADDADDAGGRRRLAGCGRARRARGQRLVRRRVGRPERRAVLAKRRQAALRHVYQAPLLRPVRELQARSRLPILGFGCLGNACLVAWRDDAGKGAHRACSARWADRGGNKLLDATGDRVSIIGVGSAALAVGTPAPRAPRWCGSTATGRRRRYGAMLPPRRTVADLVVGPPASSRANHGIEVAYETIALER